MSASNPWNALIRIVLTALHGLLKAHWFLSRPRTFGAHAVALTPNGRIVLVKLRYAKGWRLPGGGRSERESPERAVLRELREEIGLITFSEVQRVCDLDEASDFKRDLASLFVVRDVTYRPDQWSWEVEDVLETGLDELPPDFSPRAARWLQAALPMLEISPNRPKLSADRE